MYLVVTSSVALTSTVPASVCVSTDKPGRPSLSLSQSSSMFSPPGPLDSALTTPQPPSPPNPPPAPAHAHAKQPRGSALGGTPMPQPTASLLSDAPTAHKAKQPHQIGRAFLAAALSGGKTPAARRHSRSRSPIDDGTRPPPPPLESPVRPFVGFDDGGVPVAAAAAGRRGAGVDDDSMQRLNRKQRRELMRCVA